MTLGFFLVMLWRGRYLLLSAAISGALLSLIYLALFTVPVYMASAVIGAADGRGAGGNQFAAYFDFGENGTALTKFQEVMFSVRAAERLQARHGVMQHMFSGWDPNTKQWLAPSTTRQRVSDGVKHALGLPGWQPPTTARLAQVLRGQVAIQPVVQTDVVRSGLYKVSFVSPDREYAIELLTALLLETDTLLREDKMANTANRIAYLRDLIAHTQEIVLRDSLQRLLQQEEQSRMVLAADRYYTIDMIDPPDADLAPISPRASVIVTGGIAGGLTLAGLLILFMAWHAAEYPSGSGPARMPLLWGRRSRSRTGGADV